MQLVQRGDPHAFELLYDRHGGAAYSLAYRIVGKQAAAEDVVQEALLSIWRSRRRYDPTRGSVRTWILGIVHNRAIDGLRRSSVHDRRRETLDVVEERFEASERTDVEVARREEARSVRGALETLPDRAAADDRVGLFRRVHAEPDRGADGRAGGDGEGQDETRAREDETGARGGRGMTRSHALQGRRGGVSARRAERAGAAGVRAPPERLQRMPGGARAPAPGSRGAARIGGAARAAARAEGEADGGGPAAMRRRGRARAARPPSRVACSAAFAPAHGLRGGCAAAWPGDRLRRGAARRRRQRGRVAVDRREGDAGARAGRSRSRATMPRSACTTCPSWARRACTRCGSSTATGWCPRVPSRWGRTAAATWTCRASDEAQGVYVTREARGGAQVPSENPIVSVPL